MSGELGSVTVNAQVRSDTEMAVLVAPAGDWRRLMFGDDAQIMIVFPAVAELRRLRDVIDAHLTDTGETPQLHRDMTEVLRAFVERAREEDLGLAHDLLAEVLTAHGFEVAGVNAPEATP